MKFLMPLKKENVIKLLLLLPFLMAFFFQIQAQSFPLKTGKTPYLETKNGEPFFICAATYNPHEQSTEKILYHFTRLSNLGINTLFIPLKNVKGNDQPKSYIRHINLLRQITRQAALNNLLVLIYPEDTIAMKVSGKSISSKFKAYNNVIWVLNPNDFSIFQTANRSQIKAVYLKDTDSLKNEANLYISENTSALGMKPSRPVVLVYNESLFSDSAAYSLRKLAYGGLLQGSGGIILNQNTNKKWTANNPFYYQIHLFRNILDTIPLHSLEPAPGLVSLNNSLHAASVYKDKAQVSQTVLYRAQPGMFNLNLTSYKSQLKITWIHPSSGKAFHSEVMPNPAEQLFLPPNIESPDWLMFIKEEK